MEKLEGEQKEQRKLIGKVFEYIRKLEEPPEKPRRRIGFVAGKK